MKSFKELETDYHHSLVTLVDSAQAASGSLSLDKRNASLQLSAAKGLIKRLAARLEAGDWAR
jgi:hypothetical protein